MLSHYCKGLKIWLKPTFWTPVQGKVVTSCVHLLAKGIPSIKIVISNYSPFVIHVVSRFAESGLCYFDPMLQLTKTERLLFSFLITLKRVGTETNYTIWRCTCIRTRFMLSPFCKRLKIGLTAAFRKPVQGKDSTSCVQLLAKGIPNIKIVILPYSPVVTRIDSRFAQSGLCNFHPMLQLT